MGSGRWSSSNWGSESNSNGSNTNSNSEQQGTKRKRGKKHTIKSRTKAATATALRQVRDAFVARNVQLAVYNYYVIANHAYGIGYDKDPGISSLALMTIGVASFFGSKLIFSGTERHVIKYRKDGKLTMKDAVIEAMAVALPTTALMMGGLTPAAVVSCGMGAISLIQMCRRIRKGKQNKEVVEKDEEVEEVGSRHR